jgi:phage terminase small subunit
MPKTGYRPGAGRPPRKSKTPTPYPVPNDIVADAQAARMEPLEYMLAVLNDPAADATRRDRMAIAAAPYCHPRIADIAKGKKDRQAEAAETAGAGTAWAGDLEFEGRAN